MGKIPNIHLKLGLRGEHFITKRDAINLHITLKVKESPFISAIL